MLKFARGRNERAERTTPLPAGWGFLEEGAQFQVALPKQAIPDYKLAYNVKGFHYQNH